MHKNLAKLCAVLWGVFGCVIPAASAKNDAVVNVYFLNNGPFGNGDTELSVYIDGKKVKGNLDSKEGADFKVARGEHALYVEAHHKDSVLARVAPIQFSADAEPAKFRAALSSALLPGEKESGRQPEQYSFYLSLDLIGGANSSSNNQAGGAAAPAMAAMPAKPIGQPSLESALGIAARAIASKIEPKTTVAVLGIASKDSESAEFVLDELAYIIVNSGNFKVVDRKSLGALRAEQNFQSSGEVDDGSAVSIGKMLGANIVITGSISGVGSTRRLRLKALDVKTAEIMAMASEAF